MTKKIGIVTISLAQGGAERSTSLLSKILVKEGFDVHIISLTNQVDYEYSGKLFCLYSSKNNFLLQRFYRFKKYLQKEKFDYIIDNRNRISNLKEFFYLFFLYRKNKIIYVTRSYNLKQYFPPSRLISKAMIKRSFAIIGVSKEIAKHINKTFSTQKSQYIYNPIDTIQTETETQSDKNAPYILFLGRIYESIKNLTLLLEAYKNSVLTAHNIRLKIVGDGPDKDFIQSKISKLNLQNHVDLISYTPSVSPFIKEATFLALTSRYEGFPRVLIESLAMGTPVVSVDCKSGPSEIVIQEQNGLLVENYNVQKLSEAFSRMIEDKALYQHCQQNATQSVAHLKPEMIAKKWVALIS